MLFGGLKLGDVDVEVADRISLELLLRGLATADFRQSADAVTLEPAMQGRPRQMRDGRLQPIKAIVEWQQRMLPESNDDRLLLDGKDSRLGFLGPTRTIGDSLALLPFTTVFWLIP
ncbi:hypothetical protein ACVI1I_006308 [Bradyrhizobium sp. USDA 4459]